jgi:K+-transporting ATPase A subunit
MSTDNGAGMKFVVIIIFASIMVFIAGLFIGWVRDDLMQPAASERSYPPPRLY